MRASTRRLGTALGLGAAALALCAPGSTADKPPRVIVVGTPEPRPPGQDAPPVPAADSVGIPVAQVSFVEKHVDLRGPGGEWRRLPEGERVHTGDGLRTGPESVARLDFPWMSASLAPGTEIGLSAGAVLALQLVVGRVELASGRDDIIKLDTPEARVRGGGSVVVRRAGTVTQVSVPHGEVVVSAGERVVTLEAGRGCVVRSGGRCVPEPLPETPAGLLPGADPLYVAVGQPLPLAWRSGAAAFHVQVLAFDSETVLLRRDVSAASFEVAVPWPGLYRWRVSARDARGLESTPSLEGLFQVMPRDWLPSSVRTQP